MPIFTLLAIIIFTGYTVFTRVFGPDSRTGKVSGESTAKIEASPSTTPIASPKPTPTATASPSANSIGKSGSSKIEINVDSKLDNAQPASEKIIYPGAKGVGNNVYETDAGGGTVYDWYKNELNSRSYQIRNNVRTQANEKFKAILQGVSKNAAVKITIDQENASNKSRIKLE